MCKSNIQNERNFPCKITFVIRAKLQSLFIFMGLMYFKFYDKVPIYVECLNWVLIIRLKIRLN